MVFVMSCVRYWVLHAFVHFAAFVGSKDRGRQGGGAVTASQCMGHCMKATYLLLYVEPGTWYIIPGTCPLTFVIGAYMPPHNYCWILSFDKGLLCGELV